MKTFPIKHSLSAFGVNYRSTFMVVAQVFVCCLPACLLACLPDKGKCGKQRKTFTQQRNAVCVCVYACVCVRVRVHGCSFVAEMNDFFRKHCFHLSFRQSKNIDSFTTFGIIDPISVGEVFVINDTPTKMLLLLLLLLLLLFVCCCCFFHPQVVNHRTWEFNVEKYGNIFPAFGERASQQLALIVR